VRFPRARFVTTLPGGSGIALAGTMTGPRGASLDWDSARRVTPAARKSQETRPGLSHGIDLRGKRRGGAPRGERPPMRPLPHPKRQRMATFVCVVRQWMVRLSALRLPVWEDFLERGLGMTRMRRRIARTDCYFYLSPLRGERSSEARVRGPLGDSERRKFEPGG
jgi:hypothetical protein